MSGQENAGAQKNVYNAHPESPAAISAIIELKTESELLRGIPDDKSFKLIATASDGGSLFRLWRLHIASKELHPYLKIETTFTDGIKYLLETNDTQLAAANEHTIKFYNFIDKTERDSEKQRKLTFEDQKAKTKEIFKSMDKENKMKLKRADVL